eukprot:215073_1
MKKKLRKKFELYHKLNKTKCINIEKPLDIKYVSQFHLRNISPLKQRLDNPLNQSYMMDQYLPNKVHLMNKESYKCPNTKCSRYVCKPHKARCRERQATYDKRTTVLEYLPRINVKVKSNNVLLIMVQNRDLHEVKFKFDCETNNDYLYSTANISCSNEWFEIDSADIKITGGQPKHIIKNNGNYIKGREAGIHFKIKPKFYTEERDIKFSVQCILKMPFQLEHDQHQTTSLENKNNKLYDVELPYILDFELGSPQNLILSKKQ